MKQTEADRAIIVGTGAIAEAHATFYGGPDTGKSLTPKLAAVVDIDRERAVSFARRFDVDHVYQDYDQALADIGPAVVHICTPPWLHTEQTIAGLNAGAWVICEKPAAASLAELDRIEAAEVASGCYAATVFQWRYGSGMVHLKRQIEKRTPGRPLVAVCNTLWYRDEQYYAVPWRGRWSTETGGPTVIHGIHLIDALLWVMGEWDTVTAVAATLERKIETEDFSTAVVRFQNGAIATIINSVLSPRQETYLRIDFSDATVEVAGLYAVTNDQWRWTVRPDYPENERPRLQTELSTLPEEVPAAQETQIQHLYADLHAGRAPLTTGEERRRTIALLTAIYQSSATGLPVSNGSIDRHDPWYHSFHPETRS